MPRFSCAVLTIMLLLAAPGAASAFDYVPGDKALAQMSPDQAREIVSNLAAQNWVIGSDEVSQDNVTAVKISLSRFTVTQSDGHVVSLAIRDAPIGVDFSTFLSPPYVTIGDARLYPYGGQKNPDAQRLADAFYVLQQAARGTDSPVAAAAFTQIVTDYRAANPKPALPEEARRFEVQAQAAIKDGDFEGATMLFGKALEIAPWWPGGHYNRAAVLAEIGEYKLATAEMQRYLALVPEAPDARASQDKIYEWERLADKSDVRAAPASGSGAGNMGSLLGK